jgi:hypothetical protein
MAVTIGFNLFVIDTFARLHGAKAFIETMSAGIPMLEEKERLYLERRATDRQWEYEDYAVERDILGRNFETWIPTFAAYSGTVLLYSIVETQLSAFAEYVGKKRGSRVRVKDMADKGIDRSAKYLDLVLSINLKKDPAWSRLRDLQSLRNFIMHSDGKRGDSGEHAIDDLVERYKGKLEFRATDGFGLYEQIWISMDLCREFARWSEEFFERVFRIAGLTRHGLSMVNG